MMLMRRILCFLCKYHANKQSRNQNILDNLLLANFLSAFYLLVEPRSRQPEIALYQLNNTSFVYRMLDRSSISWQNDEASLNPYPMESAIFLQWQSPSSVSFTMIVKMPSEEATYLLFSKIYLAKNIDLHLVYFLQF